MLVEKLASFDVEGEVVAIHSGPVLTQFEVKPAPGVKVNQIANLADDLALAMKAQRIRIVAPIPGKGVVGIEIPNPTRPAGDDPRDARDRRIGPTSAARSRSPWAARSPARPSSPISRACRTCSSRARRVGQIGMHQRDRDEPALPLRSRRGAAHHDRSEDAGAHHLQRRAAPAASRGRRAPRIGQGSQVDGGRDGAPLPAPRRERRPQPPGLQRPREVGRRAQGDGRGRSAHHPDDRRPHRRAGGPHADGPAGDRGTARRVSHRWRARWGSI